MDQDNSFVVTPRTVMGMAIALLGVVLMLDRLNLVEASHILRFWPVPIILIGVQLIAQARDGRDRMRGAIFTIIGTWLFLSMQGLIPVRLWDLIWPIVLMLIGFGLMFRTGSGRRSRRRFRADAPLGPAGPLGPTAPVGPAGGGTAFFAPDGTAKPGTSADVTAGRPPDRFERISIFAIWSSVRRTSAASPFRGGDITAIMGGGQLDLRQAVIPAGEEAVLDIVAVMGGVEIMVPSDWEVATPLIPFMGGVEDRRFPPATDPTAPKSPSRRLVLRGLVMMGGVHIKS
jgi:predicted membrane protein